MFLSVRRYSGLSLEFSWRLPVAGFVATVDPVPSTILSPDVRAEFCKQRAETSAVEHRGAEAKGSQASRFHDLGAIEAAAGSP